MWLYVCVCVCICEIKGKSNKHEMNMGHTAHVIIHSLYLTFIVCYSFVCTSFRLSIINVHTAPVIMIILQVHTHTFTYEYISIYQQSLFIFDVIKNSEMHRPHSQRRKITKKGRNFFLSLCVWIEYFVRT